MSKNKDRTKSYRSVSTYIHVYVTETGQNYCNHIFYQISYAILVQCDNIGLQHVVIQWNPSCEASPSVIEMWPPKRGGYLSGVKIKDLCEDLLCLMAFLKGLSSHKVGLSKGVLLYQQIRLMLVLYLFVFLCILVFVNVCILCISVSMIHTCLHIYIQFVYRNR